MNETEVPNECRECKKEFFHEPIDEDFCSQGCLQNWCERADQQRIADYYGGDGPQTDRERQIKEYEGKYGVGGTHR